MTRPQLDSPSTPRSPSAGNCEQPGIADSSPPPAGPRLCRLDRDVSAGDLSTPWRRLFNSLAEFVPHPLLRNGHAQTVVANCLPGQRFHYTAVAHTILLDDGDVVILHDDRPERWQPGDRAVLLVHGLAGSHQSSYMVRLAGRLRARGIRAFRMDLRACGAGHGLSRMPFHPGQTDDLDSVLKEILRLCPGSPVSLVGFSLGGNLVLKLLGERAGDLPRQLASAVGVNPAIDLEACIQHLARPGNRFYDRHFVKLLYRQLNASTSLLEHFPQVLGAPAPRRLIELDAMYTAPVWGFEDVDGYYRKCSALNVVSQIRVPTLVLASKDDPVVPFDCFERAPLSPAVMIKASEFGGHLGFIGQAGQDPDRRWMDWRILDWIEGPESIAVSRAA